MRAAASTNLEVDNRGYVIAVDRNGAGMDILDVRGKARRIGLGLDVSAADDE